MPQPHLSSVSLLPPGTPGRCVWPMLQYKLRMAWCTCLGWARGSALPGSGPPSSQGSGHGSANENSFWCIELNWQEAMIASEKPLCSITFQKQSQAILERLGCSKPQGAPTRLPWRSKTKARKARRFPWRVFGFFLSKPSGSEYDLTAGKSRRAKGSARRLHEEAEDSLLVQHVK